MRFRTVSFVGLLVIFVLSCAPYNAAQTKKHEPTRITIAPNYPPKKPEKDWPDHGSSNNNSGSSTSSTSDGGDPRDRLANKQEQRERQALLNSMSQPGGLTNFVAARSGYLPLSVTRILKPSSKSARATTVLLTGPPKPTGHRYLVFNYLGEGLDFEATWRLISHSLDQVFPMPKVSGPTGPVALGYEYNLVVGGVPRAPATFVFPVTVTAVSQYSFTFTAKPEHWLKGSVTHAIIRDIDGKVWLFEEGNGVPGEDTSLQAINYTIADLMWARMAENIRGKLKQ